MGSAYPPPLKPDHLSGSSPPRHDEGDPDVQSLRRENARLRDLVVELSRLVFKAIVDRK